MDPKEIATAATEVAKVIGGAAGQSIPFTAIAKCVLGQPPMKSLRCGGIR